MNFILVNLKILLNSRDFSREMKAINNNWQIK